MIEHQMIEHTFFFANFTAATDEKYFSFYFLWGNIFFVKIQAYTV